MKRLREGRRGERGGGAFLRREGLVSPS